ncbi:MAG: enoyl-CoA hydratase [Pseudomonadota bacterium]
MNDLVKVELRDGILDIVLNRPDKKNALTADMYRALVAAFHLGNHENAARVMLIRGQESAFTAGNDLGDFLNDPPQDMDAPVMQLLRLLPGIAKPLVAAVGGPAVGIGTTLLLHCDYVVAADNARFQLPFVNLGLCAEGASSLLLPLLVGQRRAAELLLLGEPFGAAQALDMGLANKVVAPNELVAAAEEVAAKLAAKPAAAVRATKQLMKGHWQDAVRNAVEAEAHQFLVRLSSPEAKEAFQAFLEKRQPDFSRFG